MRDKSSYWKWGVTVFLTVCAILIFFDALFLDSTLLKFFSRLLDILSPVLYGLAMAYLLSPVLNWFERLIVGTLRSIRPLKKRNIPSHSTWLRAVSIFLTWALVLFMLYLLMSVLIPQLADSVYTLVENAETYYNNAHRWVTDLLESSPKLSEAVLHLLDMFHTSSKSFLVDEVMPRVQALVASLTGGIWNGLWNAVVLAKNLIIGIIISVYLMAMKEKSLARCCKVLYSLCSEKIARKIMHGARRINAIFSGFVRGKLLDSLIIGILCFLGCSLLNIPYTPLVSVVVGVTNVIPFFGPFLGAIPSGFLILLVSPVKCLYFVLFILLLQQLDGNVIGPKILGDSTGISSFWVIVAILVGGGFFGIAGMFLGVPVFACLQHLVKTLLNQRLVKRHMPLNADAYLRRDLNDQPPAGDSPQNASRLKRPLCGKRGEKKEETGAAPGEPAEPSAPENAETPKPSGPEKAGAETQDPPQ